MKARTLTAASLACIVLFAVIMHWPVFLQGKTVSAFDLSYFQFIAYRAERPADVERTSNGLLGDTVLLFNVWDKAMYDGSLEFPWLWNPYAACGSPLLANGQSAPFFPLKAIAYAPAGVYRGFGLLCFLKMLLAGLFMYAYIRALGAGHLARTLAAIGFMACGFMVVWLEYAITNVALTLPLVFLGCEYLVQRKLRRGFLIVSAAMALGLLGGHPETSFHIAFAAAVYVAGRLAFSMLSRRKEPDLAPRTALTSAGVFVSALLLGALVAAVHVVPNLEAIHRSALFTERSAETAEDDAASVLSLGNRTFIHHQLLACLVPNAYGNPSRHDHWWNPYTNFHGSAGYVGIGALLLAVFAWRYFICCPRIRILCVLQLLSLGFILRIPLVNDTLGRLPLFDVAANSRFLLIWCFAGAAMAGLALDELLKAGKLSRIAILWLAIIVLAFVALALRDYIRRFAPNPYEWIRAYGRTQLAHFLVFLLPWLALPFVVRLKGLLRNGLCALLIGLVALDLCLIYVGYNPFIAPEKIYPETPAIRFLQAERSPTRVLPLDAQLGPNVPALYGFQDPRIYDAVISTWYAEFLTRLGSEGPWTLVEEPNIRLCSLVGIKYLFARPEWTPTDPAGLELVYEDDLSQVYEIADALPLAYIGHQWRPVSSPAEAYDLLSQEDFSWNETVLVENPNENEALPASPEEGRPPTPATILEHRPHSVTVQIPNHSAGLLVLSDSYFPGWKAEVDGQERPIFRVNGTFRGVFVEPGDRQVVFKYEPASFRYGLILSLAGVVILLLVLLPLPRAIRRVFGARERRGR